MAHSVLNAAIMKRLFLALFAATALAAGPARADVVIITNDSRVDPNLLLINPGDLLSGVVSLEYERALNPWFGITGGLSVWAFRGPFIPFNQPYYTAFVPEVGVKFHFIRDAPAGLWFGPTISAGYVASRSDGSLSRAFAWGLGASVGYNFVFGRHFTFQIGAGGRFTDYGDGLYWSPRLILGLGAVF